MENANRISRADLANTWPVRLARGIAESIKSGATLAGDVVDGKFTVTPEVPGQWSEVDEFRRQQVNNEMIKRSADLAGLATLGATAAPAGALGAGFVRRGKAPLPMDEASRMARERQLGYSDTPFYRGEASGTMPRKYPGGAYFSRDEDYARGFAHRGGFDEPREFRLNLTRTFSDNAELTLAQYARLVRAASKVDAKNWLMTSRS